MRGCQAENQGSSTLTDEHAAAALASLRSKLKKGGASVRLGELQRIREVHAAGHPLQGRCEQRRLFDRDARESGEAVQRGGDFLRRRSIAAAEHPFGLQQHRCRDTVVAMKMSPAAIAARAFPARSVSSATRNRTTTLVSIARTALRLGSDRRVHRFERKAGTGAGEDAEDRVDAGLGEHRR